MTFPHTKTQAKIKSFFVYQFFLLWITCYTEDTQRSCAPNYLIVCVRSGYLGYKTRFSFLNKENLSCFFYISKSHTIHHKGFMISDYSYSQSHPTFLIVYKLHIFIYCFLKYWINLNT